MAKFKLKNSPDREPIELGTVIRFPSIDVVGVVYEDTPDGMLRLNLPKHRKYSFRPMSMPESMYYEVLEEHEPVVLNGSVWDFESNTVKDGE